MLKIVIIKIVKLFDMKVISFHSWGEFIGDPESKSFQKLDDWIKEKSIPLDPLKHQIFGFNNPSPHINDSGEHFASKDNPYGYEVWITIPEDYEIEENMKAKTVEGGLYCVVSVRGANNIGKGWKFLFDWLKKSEEYDIHPNWKGLSKYYDEDHVIQGIIGLEYIINYPKNDEDNFLMDIYFPIIERD